jgi:hypothetical protein
MLILSNFCILCLLEKRVHKDGALCLPIEQGSFHCQLHFIDGLIGNTNFLEQGKFFFIIILGMQSMKIFLELVRKQIYIQIYDVLSLTEGTKKVFNAWF